MPSYQSKNVHTGTGLIKAAQSKGPVSASGLAENLSKTTPKVSCKMENILSPNVMIKPENDKTTEHLQQKQSDGSINLKILDTSSELISSPARGSSGMQKPSVQHETVQPNESDNNRKRLEHQITPLSIYQTAFMGE